MFIQTFMQCLIHMRLTLIGEEMEWLAQADLSTQDLHLRALDVSMDHYLTVQAAKMWYPGITGLTN